MTSDLDRMELLKPDTVVRGALFPEPVQVILAIPLGPSIKLIGKGLRTGQVYEPILSADQHASLEISPAEVPFDGDAKRFRLGIEALRLRLAYEYDPYFTLFLELLDRDVYGDVQSLEEAMRRNEAPFYLRRVKEAMVKPLVVTIYCYFDGLDVNSLHTVTFSR